MNYKKQPIELQSKNVSSRSYKEQLIDIDLQTIFDLIGGLVPVAPSYGVYTAIIIQKGAATEDSINSGKLVIGTTYIINQESIGMDFTNVGATSNDLGTAFVATGDTPNSWGEGALYTLAYNAGVPVVAVLENTIGDIWFGYNAIGEFSIMSNGLFTDMKTFTYIGSDPNFDQSGNPVSLAQIKNQNDVQIDINTFTIDAEGLGVPVDGLLAYGTPIEIRVYNSDRTIPQ